jgi:hypothetical protein
MRTKGEWIMTRRIRSTAMGLLLPFLGLGAVACGGHRDRSGEVSDFTSVPANAGSGVTAGTALNASTGSNGSSSADKASSTTPTRTVEETDLYRLEGDRLYYLNSYRGLMVFDVSTVDSPRLLGRSPIFGQPIEMVVRNGVASVVVADWYGATQDGKPFHGSIVRGIDATDPSNLRIVGEALLGGWVRDTRVVGDVLYAVTEQYPWDIGWYEGGAVSGGGVSVGVATVGGGSGSTVAVTSVSFAGGSIRGVDSYVASGQGGIFNVTPNSILLGSNQLTDADPNGYRAATGNTELRYLDISDPGGVIREAGAAVVSGSIQGWGADNGRWNLDFADGKTAHAITCSGQYCGSGGGLVLSVVDFTNPDSPTKLSALAIPSTSWSPTARFDTGRMYLSPSTSDCYGSSGQLTTPVEVFDLSDPSAPRLAGSASITGAVWLFMPAGNRLFALGYDCTNTGVSYGSNVSLRYLDVSNPSAPQVLGTASFGQGWAWTPAAGTFKAFTKNDAEGLVVLPFSGWDPTGYQYNNGLQLIEFTPSSIATSGTAHTRGWVERGVFVKNRLVSLSDLSLAVIDYSNHAQLNIVSELTLARNVVDVKPQGATVAELSSDFWDNDQDHSTLRVLPVEQAEENVSGSALGEVEIDGHNSSVFHNGNLSYVVSNVRRETDCSNTRGTPVPTNGAAPVCYAWTQEIQVVDRTGGSVVKRGKIALPEIGDYWYGGWGWYGCYAWDWYYGSDAVSVGGDALVFRRWLPDYSSGGALTSALGALFVVDLSQPDHPSLASVTVTSDPTGWWGNLRAVGKELYATHWEWVRQPSSDGTRYDPGLVKYYLDRVDLTDRAHPKIGAKVNVPGVLVGASETDPALIYTMDYRWTGDRLANRFDVLRLSGDRAYLKASLQIPGWVGNTFVRGNTAYFTVQSYDSASSTSSLSLYQVDLSNPSAPVILPSQPTKGWGWLLGVEGDRAFVTSGWGNVGIDVFKLSPGAPPTFDRFVRTRGWWTSSLARQDNQLFLASGYWGTQVVGL